MDLQRPKKSRAGTENLIRAGSIGVGKASVEFGQKSAVDRILRHLAGSNRRPDQVGILGLAERNVFVSERSTRSVLNLSNKLLMVGVGARTRGSALAFLGGHDGCA